MEKIDLTKCNNCRAWVRYRYGRVEGTGRIEKVTEGGEVWMRFVTDEDGALITMWEDGKISEHIMDFEIVPRDPETYKGWQVGDSLLNEDISSSGELPDGRVIFRSGEFVVIADWQGNAIPYTCDELYDEGYRLVLTDIEKQIIGEKKEKRYEPQAGDIVAWKEKEDEGRSAISIYRKKNRAYFTLFVDGVTGGLLHNLAMNIIRPATKDEKQKLFDAMAKKGMRWNAEKKVVEDIPKPYEFKKGEPVLVRSDRTHCWQLRAISLSVYGNPPKVEVTDGCDEWICWIDKDEVVPYNERTMHLLGTAEDYKEE